MSEFVIPSVKFEGGRLKYFLREWKGITSDINVLNKISGTKIEFLEVPYQIKVPSPIKFSETEKCAVNVEIVRMLEKKIISRVTACQGQFISSIFTRPKTDGSLRVILNLEKLNDFIQYRHFKIDNLESALKLVSKDCYMASIDLKDAYFSVPIYEGHRKYFRFLWEGDLFQFSCYPQGLASAPRNFTKICKPMYSTLRKLGHNCIGYIDDSFLQGDTFDECTNNIKASLELIMSLGFIVHPNKSVIIPTQKIKFLGV